MRKYASRMALHGGSQAGVTILELLTIMFMMSTISGIAIFSLRAMIAASNNASLDLASFLKQARAQAMASTSAYQVSASTNSKIIVKTAPHCADSGMTIDPRFSLNLRDGATLTNTGWAVCFTSRGLATSNTSITVLDPDGDSRDVEVFLGGAVQVH